MVEPNPLTQELQQASLKIALLEEVLRYALPKDEHKIPLPKKFTTKLWCCQKQRRVNVAMLCPLLGLIRKGHYAHLRNQTQHTYEAHVVLKEVRRIRELLPP